MKFIYIKISVYEDLFYMKILTFFIKSIRILLSPITHQNKLHFKIWDSDAPEKEGKDDKVY